MTLLLLFLLDLYLFISSQDGEPVSKNADEFMNKADAMLADKKASSEQHKVRSINLFGLPHVSILPIATSGA